MCKAVDEALFSGKAMDEVKVGFPRLDTKLTHLVIGAAIELKPGNALTLEHQFKNLRHGFLLEDAPVRTQAGTGQLRLDHSVVARATEAGFTLAEGTDQAMHMTQWPVCAIKGE